jgi:hypothetical protein
MPHLIATLHTLGVRLLDGARDRLDSARAGAAREPERGNVTIEQVLWAVAVIAIVAIVVGVITTYVTNTAAKIT